MTITRHLDDATLMSYAAGSLPAALAAVAAAHAAMCPRCRRELGHLERVGSAIVAGLAPAAMHKPQPSEPSPLPIPSPPRGITAAGDVPAPLARLIGERLDDIPWRRLGPGVWHYPLRIAGQGDLRLFKAAPGRGVPEHGHAGSELTLVLRGALQDATGRYGRGDVADLDESVEHHPVADAEAGCICIVASESPARFRGLLARLLQPLHRM